MRRVKLGQICEVVSGGTPKTNVEEYWNGKFNWITPAEINDDDYVISETKRKITELAIEKKKLPLLPKGTVLLSSRAPIGKVAIAGNEMYCNQGFKNLICSDEIYNEYLYWYLKSKREYLNSLGRGATFKEISKKIVENIEIKLPRMEQQRKIADKLKKVDKIIRQRKAQKSLLDSVVQARFVEMFGDENNSKKWEIINVEEIAEVQVGVVVKPAQYYTDEDKGIKAFRSLNIGEGYIKNTDWVYFTLEGHQKNSKSILKENDLLIVRSGAPGTTCVVTKEYEGCNAVDVIIAHPNCEKVNPYYLCAYTNMPHGKKQIVEGTGGAAQQHFNVGKYNKLKLMMPPLKLQNQFATFVQQINKSKFVIHKFLYCTTHNTQSIIKPRPNTKESGKNKGRETTCRRILTF